MNEFRWSAESRCIGTTQVYAGPSKLSELSQTSTIVRKISSARPSPAM
jgi:hypothetical protein